MRLTTEVREGYFELYENGWTMTDAATEEAEAIAEKIAKNIAIYEGVARRIVNDDRFLEKYGANLLVTMQSIAWLIGIIHHLEANGSFDKHLHNGDPLFKGRMKLKTVNAPSGRPKGDVDNIMSENYWKASAFDAMAQKIFDRRWNHGFYRLDDVLFFLERWNGFGYRAKKINSPYLWGRTSNHTKGKFVSDGQFNPEAKTKQIGAAAIIFSITDRWEDGNIFGDKPAELDQNNPIPIYHTGSPKKKIEELQCRMNKLIMEFNVVSMEDEPSMTELRVDGSPGPKTQRRFNELF